MSSAGDTWPYSAREAAALLGVSERTIRRAIARGALAATKHAGTFRITPDALTAYDHQRRRSTPPLSTSARVSVDRFPRTSNAPPLLHLVNRSDGPAFALPQPLTSFLGREQELAGIVAMLSRPGVRLLPLTGPGGGAARSATAADHR